MDSKFDVEEMKNSEGAGISRRAFLEKAIAISGAAVAGATFASGDDVFASRPVNKELFEMRPLGKTGLKVSSLGMGQAMESAVYIHAYERGMNLIETSRGYRGGSHEEIVGKAIKKIGRKNVVLLTKVDKTTLQRDDYYGNIMGSVERSLEALRTDYIDILMGHSVDSVDIPADKDVKRAFGDLKKKGKIRFSGFSTHKAGPVVEWVTENGFYDVMLVGFNFASPPEMSKLLARARSKGIGIITMKTLAFNVNERRKAIPAALRYAVSRDFVDSSVVLMADFEKLNSNLKALDRGFSKDDLELLKRNVRPSISYF